MTCHDPVIQAGCRPIPGQPMNDDPPLIVSIDWLAEHHESVGVVDVRDDWEYEGIGHIPGAVSMPFHRFRSAADDEPGMLPGIERFEELMGGIGIEPGQPIVAYDDEHGVFAARLLVTAMLYGHDEAHLLDGDFTAWSRSYETSTEAPSVVPTDYRVTVPDDRPLIDAEGVRAAVGAQNTVLLDTRTPEEFAEGHIEGAINIDWRTFVDPETRGIKSEADIRAILASMGIGEATRIVLYCNTARRISHTYLVLRHLGYQLVDFYEGSLTEWRDRELPLVQG